MASASAASVAPSNPQSKPLYSSADAAIRASNSNARGTNNASSGSLKTPLSATYPSAIPSPIPSGTSQSFLRPSGALNDPVKTPLTPPSAYFDFLRILSPAAGNSPLSTGTSTHFSFRAGSQSPAWPSTATASAFEKPYSMSAPPLSARRSPTPSSQDSPTDDSASLSSASSSALSAAAGPAARSSVPPVANSSKPLARPSTGTFPATTASCPPPNPTSAPSSRPGAPPRRPSLVIPPSPTSSITTMSANPHSSTSAPAGPQSSISAGMSARTPWSTRSPWHSAISPFPGGGSNQSPVKVRHVVTRTITYSRPAPQSNPGRTQQPAKEVKGESGETSEASTPGTKREGDEDGEDNRASKREDREEGDVETEKAKPLVGEVPRGKRRRVE